MLWSTFETLLQLLLISQPQAMTTEITEILLDVDLHFLGLNDIANHANELNKNEENTTPIESLEHNVSDVSIIFVQEVRKFGLFHTCDKSYQEEFDSNNDAVAFLELFTLNLSILFDKISFSE